MRRIALVCDWYAPRRGGIEVHLDGLATRLAARGHDVRVITSTPGPPEVNGIRVHRLDVPRVPLAGVAIAPVVTAVQRILEQERCEVVHSHVSIVSPVALGAGLAAHRAGLPFVLTFHSFVPATPLLASAAGHLLGASSWSAVMTAVSQRVIREVRSFAPRKPFSVLPNAIDTSFWYPCRPEPACQKQIPRFTQDDTVLVYAGRLQAKKRPLLLLKVARALAATDRPWRIVVAGEGPLEKPLRDGFARLGVSERVTFAGWLDPVGLRDLLHRADGFLSTSARESFGLAALEARAAGVPLVAVADSAVSDFITDGESGLLAASDEDFAAATVRLAIDEPLRQRIATHNRTVPVTLDWEHTLSLHQRVYESALAGNG